MSSQLDQLKICYSYFRNMAGTKKETFFRTLKHSFISNHDLWLCNPFWWHVLLAKTVCWLFLQRSFVVDLWRNSKCDSAWRSFSPLSLHKGMLNAPYLLILWSTQKHKNNKMKSWTGPKSSFSSRKTHRLAR